MVSATLLSACGSQLGPAALGTETTTTTRPTTTTAPPETTSTVDFDRPVRQQLTPLPEEPTVADVEGMIRDIRGQTDDVSAQMARLVRFVDIATPVPAQIIDIGIRIDVANDEGLHEQRAAVLFRTGATVDEVLTFLDHQLRGAGWNRSKSERIQVDGIETVVESFRVPGVPASEEELTVRVADGPDATRIELAHFSLSADHAAAWELLPAWHDGLPLPRGAERAGITLRTEDDVGSVMVTHDVGAETPARGPVRVPGPDRPQQRLRGHRRWSDHRRCRRR